MSARFKFVDDVGFRRKDDRIAPSPSQAWVLPPFSRNGEPAPQPAPAPAAAPTANGAPDEQACETPPAPEPAVPELTFDESELVAVAAAIAGEAADDAVALVLWNEAQATAEGLAAIRQGILDLEGLARSVDAEVVDMALALAKKVVRQVVPEAIKAVPIADAVVQLGQLFARLQVEREVIVRAHPDTVDALETALKSKVADPAGELHARVIADPETSAGSVAVSWGEGSAVYSPQSLMDAADAILDAWRSQCAGDDETNAIPGATVPARAADQTSTNPDLEDIP